MSKLSRRRMGAQHLPQAPIDVPEPFDSAAPAQPLRDGTDSATGAGSDGVTEQATNRHQREATSAMRRTLASFRRMWL